MPDATLDRIEQDLAALERTADGTSALDAVLAPAIALVVRTLRARLEADGKAAPADDADLLEVWRALVKGDPSWNAIRDNCRELVFYRNCLARGRADAVPAAPHRMAVRTARHILLYVRSRAESDARARR
jgi:hypothetical protein